MSVNTGEMSSDAPLIAPHSDSHSSNLSSVLHSTLISLDLLSFLIPQPLPCTLSATTAGLACFTNPAAYAVLKSNTLQMILHVSPVSPVLFLDSVSTLTHTVSHPTALH